MSTATLSQARKSKPTTRLPWAFVVLIALAACSCRAGFRLHRLSNLLLRARAARRVRVEHRSQRQVAGRSRRRAGCRLQGQVQHGARRSERRAAGVDRQPDRSRHLLRRARHRAGRARSLAARRGRADAGAAQRRRSRPAHRLQSQSGARLLRADGRADQSPADRCRRATERHAGDHHARADRARVERRSDVETAAGPRQDRRAEAHRAADRDASSRASPMCPPSPRSCRRFSIAT